MLAEREGLTRTILEAFKSPTLYGGKVGTRRSLRPRPQELGYIFSMGYKIYVERNALRLWIWDLKRQGKIQLVLFPYDGRNPAGVQLATPSVVTCDSTWVTWDMTIPISDMVGSDKFEQIRQILRLENEKKIMAPARAHRGEDGGGRPPPRHRVQVWVPGLSHDG